ncbi:U2 small nuclear ribonucleoprotein auxiliary factor 35 kDa subunit-related protein 2-like isoform X3 [Penaeus japonicus]|uniref:U2 small nuclear ribonucleoprotein auxiliary factor 35 kDa subunit-related protein 2-like isoform X3 n=1 Tax=Penaeus japonicus TaxID=27405 RepID=UPI001C71762D|nr:U2 small nuclear ribonucleoprotein auxiliary factor 35 kDa subunit-related protein 2-like isoform X3 [Penaeus japonicus]
MLVELKERVSHQQWRRIARKERRRRVRQQLAQERDARLQEEQEALLADPEYVAELERIERLEEEAQRLEQLAAAQEKREWNLRDAALHSKFLREKQKRCQQEEERVKQEELIKTEWEEKQQKEKEEEEKKQEQQNALLQAVVEGLGETVNGEVTQNPEPPEGYSRREVVRPKGEPCPFFTKTGACRFGIQCSRDHEYPDQSRTLLFPNMYSHFGLEHLALDVHDSDVALEYSDSESYQHFKDFFEDTLPEFQRCGTVLQFKVCCNTSPHLRGNVYVQYANEESAMKARTLFNGRWYAGRQLTCLYINLERWKQAVCGLFWRQKCPKGGQCNFLHAFRNPGNAFWRADQDLHLESPRDPSDGSRFTPAHRNSYGRHQETSSRHSSSTRSTRSSRNTHGSRSRSRSLTKERIARKSDGKEHTSRKPKLHKSPDTKTNHSRSRSAESRDRLRRSRSRTRRSRSRSAEQRSRSRRSRSRSAERKNKSRRSRSRSAEQRNKSRRSRSRSTEQRSKSKRSRSRSAEQRSKSLRSRSRSTERRSKPKRSRSRSAEQRSKSLRSRSRSAERRSKSKRSKSKSAERRSKSKRSRSKSAEQSSKSKRSKSRSAEQRSKSNRSRSRSAEQRSRSSESATS